MTAAEPVEELAGEHAGGETVRRSAAFSVAVQVAGTVFTAVLTLFLVRALGRAEFGRYSIVLAVGAIVLLPSDLGISTSAARSLAEAYGDAGRIRTVLSVALRLKFVLALGTGAVIALAAPAIADLYGDDRLVIPLRVMGIAIAAHSLFAFTTTAYTALRRMRVVLGLVTLESLGETATAIAFVAAGAGVAGAVAGRAIGYGSGALLGLALLARRHGGARSFVRDQFDRALARRLAVYAGAIAVVDIIWAVLSQIDVLIIGALLSTTAVASFQAPSRLLSLATYPGLALSYALGPRLARGTGSAASTVQTLSTTARSLVLVQAFAAGCVVVFAPEIVAVALGRSYEHTSAEAVLRVLAPYVALSGLAPLLSNAIDYVGGARKRIWIAAVTLVANVALNLALLPLIGPVGAAIALDVGYGLFVVGHVAVCSKLLDFSVSSISTSSIRAAAAAGAMIGVAELGRHAISGPLGVVVGGAAGVAAFVAVIVAVGESAFVRALVGQLSFARTPS